MPLRASERVLFTTRSCLRRWAGRGLRHAAASGVSDRARAALAEAETIQETTRILDVAQSTRPLPWFNLQRVPRTLRRQYQTGTPNVLAQPTL